MNSLERRVGKLEQDRGEDARWAWASPCQYTLEDLHKATERVRSYCILHRIKEPEPIEWPPEAAGWGVVEKLEYAREWRAGA